MEDVALADWRQQAAAARHHRLLIVVVGCSRRYLADQSHHRDSLS